ncbi:uncharacterized protein LOC135495162 [Lineus longissimus]|uniref:uncharacterized protein LOC135495162 n=1 Tax=Lineus longissimus TaxID=88925 RepID=UPI002B4CB53E
MAAPRLVLFTVVMAIVVVALANAAPGKKKLNAKHPVVTKIDSPSKKETVIKGGKAPIDLMKKLNKMSKKPTSLKLRLKGKTPKTKKGVKKAADKAIIKKAYKKKKDLDKIVMKARKTLWKSLKSGSPKTIKIAKKKAKKAREGRKKQ